ncbi:hypothetical protein ABK040_010754 [Willaertia magna]
MLTNFASSLTNNNNNLITSTANSIGITGMIGSNNNNNSTSLTFELNNNKNKLLNNPVLLFQLIIQQVQIVIEKGKEIDKKFGETILNEKLSIFNLNNNNGDNSDNNNDIAMDSNNVNDNNNVKNGGENESGNDKIPIDKIKKFFQQEFNTIVKDLPNIELLNKLFENVDGIINNCKEITNFYNDNNTTNCFLQIITICIAAVLKEMEENVKEEWNKFENDFINFSLQFKDKFLNLLKESINKIQKINFVFLENVEKNVMEILKLTKSFPKEVIQDLEIAVKNHLNEMKDFKNLIIHLKEKNFVINQVEQFHLEIKKIIDKLVNLFIKELFENLIENFKNFIFEMSNVISELLKNSFHLIIECLNESLIFLNEIPERIKNIFDFHSNCYLNLMMKKPQNLIDNILNILNNLLNFKFNQLINQLKQFDELIKNNNPMKLENLENWKIKITEMLNIKSLLLEQIFLLNEFDENMNHVKEIVRELEEKGMNFLIGDNQQQNELLQKVEDIIPSGVKQLEGTASKALSKLKNLF